MLIFPVFKIASISAHWLQIKFYLSPFFYFLLLWSICGTVKSSQQTSLQCLFTIDMVFDVENKILIISLYLKEYTAKRLTDEFSEKICTNGVKKLLKKLRDTGTVDRRPSSDRTRSVCTEENIQTVTDLILSQEDKPHTSVHIHDISRETGIHRSFVSCISLKTVWNVSRDIFPYLVNICRKFKFLISQGSVAICLRWVKQCRV